jgi:ABC-2 type transport system ATP-binding protein
MLQDGGLPVTTTPERLLRHVARLHASPAEVSDLMGRLDLDRVGNRSIRRLSGGERQRVALAAALVGHPDVAFLDEPTAGLDPHARIEVWDLLRETARGAAVVVTTHSFEEAERIADHVVIMSSGRVVAEGSLDEVRDGRPLEERYFALTAGGRS